MSDLAAHLVTMRARAHQLEVQLDSATTEVLDALETAREISNADFDVACELSATDHDDLMNALETALRALRGAERTTREHASEIRQCHAKVNRNEDL